MSFKWLFYTVTVWTVLAFLCGLVEGAMVTAGAQNTLNTIMQSDFASSAFWSSLADMMTFNFPALFSGSYTMLRWVFFMPLALTFGVMMGGFILSHIPIIGRGS